jgi:Tannase-like family of unknown function (DUF6351)
VQVRQNNNRVVSSLAVACGVLAGLAAGSHAAWAQSALGIEVLSSRAELVTGGDALVRISSPETPKVMVEGNDKSGAFRADQKNGWVGLVDGLKDGSNQLVVKAGGK